MQKVLERETWPLAWVGPPTFYLAVLPVLSWAALSIWQLFESSEDFFSSFSFRTWDRSCLPLSLTDPLLFSRLDWCVSGCWRRQLKFLMLLLMVLGTALAIDLTQYSLTTTWTQLTAWQQLDNSFSQVGDTLEMFGCSLWFRPPQVPWHSPILRWGKASKKLNYS